ncbi:type VI-A CRISPR-associated RNA-guided ribonuclease Cas13a [Listeria seeligeri]|uniref:type VI-A CRISPR-associated RNA-guided ribonuclease Cas13a n=1 Tax=Listeria seeligeri TaxID=1640 RepID=UPI001887577A|nr:type VI-A CRISPR-associated RNA-guided ribonuclease Cas13a [Listeria seeligeri]MBF2599328.1 CRISPR-associated endoribonuclease Cas13a [Listeria seeligeri]
MWISIKTLIHHLGVLFFCDYMYNRREKKIIEVKTMRITKVEVDRKKVLISRDKNGGKLVYENEMQDNTEQIMHHKKSSFYKSVVNKTICRPEQKQMKKLFHGLLQENSQEKIKVSDVTKLNISNFLNHRFKKSLYYFPENSPDKSEEYRIEINLSQLLEESLKKQQGTFICWEFFSKDMELYINWAENYISSKTKLIKKSIRNNIIQSTESRSGQLMDRYMKDILNKNKPFDIQSLSEKYQLEKLTSALKATFKEAKKNDKEINYKLKSTLQNHERQIIEELKENSELNQFNIEIRKHLETYFPIKKTNRKVGDIRNLEIGEIQKIVNHRLKNKIVQRILQEGKLASYEIESTVNSNSLQKIKIEEAFALKFINACLFASNNLRNMVYPVCKKDILMIGEFKNSFKEIKHKKFIRQWSQFFSQEITVDDIELASWGLRGAIAPIRNEIIHLKKHSWKKFFNNPTFKVKKSKIINGKTKDVTSEFLYKETLFKDYFYSELDSVPELIINKMESSKILDYYSSDQLNQVFTIPNFELSLLTSAVPFAPSFKRVYLKGFDYQNQDEAQPDYNLKLNIYNEKAFNSEAFQAQYSLFKMVYYQVFLPQFTTNNDLFKSSVDFILTLNKERKGYAKAFQDIRKMNKDEKPSEYMSYIQSQLMLYQKKQEEKEKINHFEKFINQVFIKGFNSFIEKNRLTYICHPTKNTVPENDNIEIPFHTDMDDSNIAFWLMCKLLDAKQLSELRNEMIKFSCSLQSTEEISTFTKAREVIGLALLNGEKGCNDWKELFDDKEAWKKNMSLYVSEELLQSLPYTQEDGQTPVINRSIDLVKKYGTETILEKLFSFSNDYKVSAKDIAKLHEYDVTEKIAQQESLHKQWIEKPGLARDSAWTKKYQNVINDISNYQWAKTKVELTQVRHLHQLTIDLLSRLAGYMSIADRDFQFSSNYILERENSEYRVASWILLSENKNKNKYNDYELYNLKNASIKVSSKNDPQLKVDLKQLRLTLEYLELFDNRLKEKRNNISHFNYLNGQLGNSILELFDDARDVLSYDRKLKNAVSKSLKEILSSHGMEVTFKPLYQTNHHLKIDKLQPKKIHHLGEKSTVSSNQVSNEYCQLVRTLLTMK